MLYPWLTKTYDQLVQCYQTDQLAQAILVGGDVDQGADQLALQLAKVVLCSDVNRSGCGTCQACKMFDAGTHPDFTHVVLERHEIIKLESIQAIIEKVHQTAHMSGNRVVIIESIEQMNRSAANAFLKTLEEPNRGVYFILTSGHVQHIMPTILSRLQKWIITFDSSLVRSWLRQQCAHQPEQIIEEAFRLSQSKPLLAQQWLKEEYFLSDREDILQSLLLSQQAVAQAEKLLASYTLPDILYWLQILLSDIRKLQHDVSVAFLMNQTQVERLSTIAQKLSIDMVDQLYKRISVLKYYELKKLNINPQLALENLYIELGEKYGIDA